MSSGGVLCRPTRHPLRNNQTTAMKNATLLLVSMMILGLAACSSDTTGPSNPLAMSFTMDGTTWTAGTVAKSGTGTSAYLVGTAQRNGTTETMAVMLDTVAAGRTIKLGSDSVSFGAPSAVLTRGDGMWKTQTGSGSVTISEASAEHGKATFGFVLYRRTNVGVDSMIASAGSLSW